MAVSAEPMTVKIVLMGIVVIRLYKILLHRYTVTDSTGYLILFQLRRTVVVIRLYRLILPVYRVVVPDPTGYRLYRLWYSEVQQFQKLDRSVGR